MSNSVSFIICSLFYSILLLFVSNSRIGNNKKMGNRVYKLMSISILISLILEISNYFTVLNIKSVGILNLIVSKSYLVSLMTWDTLFVLYIYLVSNKKEEEDYLIFKKSKIYKAFAIFYLISILLMVVLPIEFSSKVGEIYSYGTVVDAAFVITEIMAAFCIFEMFKNIKKVGSKKYAPFFMFIAGGILVMLIQSTYPQMLLLTSLDLFITYLTFFSFTSNNKIKKQ